ncbi:MAG: alpha/beta fold hydrolase [Bacteroidetes bacterium]|nr:alpha/beta fold hydrolase [Bacteroidota bacterium]
MRTKFCFFLTIIFTITVFAQEQVDKEIHPYAKLSKKFIGAVKRNDPNKNSRFFDTTQIARLIEAQTDKQIDAFTKKHGPITYIEKTEIDTQGCKIASATAVKVKEGKYIWRILFDQAERIERFEIDTFSQPFFYQMPALQNKNFTRKNISIQTTPFITLPGYLYMPNNVKKAPAVVLVHGSGPNSMNEDVGLNKVFLDIALNLVQKGIAVFIYDKRTYVYTTNYPYPLDSMDYYSETINDAVYAVHFLKQQTTIDSSKITVIGHSLGAMCGPKIAELSQPNKLVLLAPAARPLVEILPEQIEYIANLDGIVTDDEKRQITQLKWLRDKILDQNYNLKSKITLPGTRPKYWICDKNFKPTEIAKKITKPILLLQGGRDYNVVKKDFDLWNDAMQAQKNYKSVWLNELDHLFMKGVGMAKPIDIKTPGHVSEVANDLIYNFVK